jgi:uncharacterized protein HemX
MVMKKVVLTILLIALIGGPARAHDFSARPKSFGTTVTNFVKDNPKFMISGALICAAILFIYKTKSNANKNRIDRAQQQKKKADERQRQNERFAKENEEHERRMEEINKRIRQQQEEDNLKLELEQKQFDDQLREFDRKVKEEDDERARKQRAEQLAVLRDLMNL